MVTPFRQRRVLRLTAVTLAVPIALLLAACGPTLHTGYNDIPDEFRTPLGCDTRSSDSVCGERSAIYEACDLGLMPRSRPASLQRGSNGVESTWVQDGETVAVVTYGQGQVTFQTNRCSKTITQAEWDRLLQPGSEDDLPAALR
ncbi:hypothetical protein ACIGG9_16160 [Pseudonocardia alni]|uniref:hypothetical protein n=1 Tax=Pseudonocardia alni TaxID=33907 RepID=UPI0033D9D9AB